MFKNASDYDLSLRQVRCYNFIRDYHKTRATVYWGKTSRQWHQYISDNIGDGQKMPSIRYVGAALRKGKKFFDWYLAGKLGKPRPKRKLSAQHKLANALALSFTWVTPAGKFIGKRKAAEANGITISQLTRRLKKDPKNWYKEKAKIPG